MDPVVDTSGYEVGYYYCENSNYTLTALPIVGSITQDYSDMDFKSTNGCMDANMQRQ